MYFPNGKDSRLGFFIVIEVKSDKADISKLKTAYKPSSNTISLFEIIPRNIPVTEKMNAPKVDIKRIRLISLLCIFILSYPLFLLTFSFYAYLNIYSKLIMYILYPFQKTV